MLLLLTTLDIAPKMTKEKFIQLVLDWNEGSPFEENRIPGIHWDGSFNVRYGSEKLWMEIRECQAPSIVAVRYEKVDEEGRIWNTDYIMNFDEMRMAIQLDRSFREDAHSFDPKFSAPRFLNLLIHRDYVKPDGPLAVSLTPHPVSWENARELADIIKGRTHCHLPVIYVSKTRNNENPVDVDRLCNRVKGIAHVLVQEDKQDNNRIGDLCDESNAYNGAIDIYMPNQSAGNKRHSYQQYQGEDPEQLDRVVQTVLRYVNTQQIAPRYTWQGVNALMLRAQLENQQARLTQAEAVSNARTEEIEMRVLDEFAGEMDEKDRRIRELEDRLAILSDTEGMADRVEQLEQDLYRATEENKAMQKQLDRLQEAPGIHLGEEQDFYEGEIREFVLSAVEKEVAGCTEDSRRSHVLRDILKANGYQRLHAARREEVKRLLKTYTRMTGPVEKGLKELGWTYTADGTHYKLTYYQDNRYQTVLPKTPSDVRTGENAVSEIIKKTL